MSESISLAPPFWALGLVDPTPDAWTSDEKGVRTRSSEGPGFSLASAAVPAAASLDAAQFQRATQAAYESIHRELRGHDAARPIRFWNLIPGILEPLEPLPHRYMAFNAGRHAAYLHWYEHPEEVARQAATASAVGHAGSSLVIHCLAATEPGRSIENPRQTPAREYSARYGPVPPCFARATRLERNGPSWLLIGGTASVCGETSLHERDLVAQLDETVRNLRALLETSSMGRAIPRSVRAYYVRAQDKPFLQNALERHFPAAVDKELVPAQLCRPELLVEIEALYVHLTGQATATA
ncbi:MAG: hypothetical protein P8R42_10610 [Candidatus Binatia bacterium]|nr:hypothetical protein [Candidatus Binatia bacterium]